MARKKKFTRLAASVEHEEESRSDSSAILEEKMSADDDKFSDSDWIPDRDQPSTSSGRKR